MQFAKKTIAVKDATYVAAKKNSVLPRLEPWPLLVYTGAVLSNQLSKQASWGQLRVISLASWFVLYLKKMKM